MENIQRMCNQYVWGINVEASDIWLKLCLICLNNFMAFYKFLKIFLLIFFENYFHFSFFLCQFCSCIV